MGSGYYLTLHPSTRPASLSPGTPERPLSDLGLKGYTVYWVSVVLRFLRRLLVDAPPIQNPVDILIKSPIKPEGRTLRRREPVSLVEQIGEVEEVNGVIIRKNAIANHKGQYAIALTLQEVAKACHLRVDDTAFTLGELGLLRQRRTVTVRPKMGARKDESMVWPAGSMAPYAGERGEERDGRKMELGEWRGVEVVVTWEAVSEMWVKWRVKEKGMLDNDCVLL
jgi:histone acetyltransferase HTATIP